MENSQNNESVERPSPKMAVAILAVVVVAIIAWFVVASRIVSEVSFIGGFLMLWYWAAIDELSVKKLPASLLGALAGIGLAWVLFFGVHNYGSTGLAVGLVAVLAAIYSEIRKVIPLVINQATMLFLTVAAAPLIQLHVNWLELCIATVLGAVFFAGFIEGVKWIGGKLMPAAA